MCSVNPRLLHTVQGINPMFLCIAATITLCLLRLDRDMARKCKSITAQQHESLVSIQRIFKCIRFSSESVAERAKASARRACATAVRCYCVSTHQMCSELTEILLTCGCTATSIYLTAHVHADPAIDKVCCRGQQDDVCCAGQT